MYATHKATSGMLRFHTPLRLSVLRTQRAPRHHHVQFKPPCASASMPPPGLSIMEWIGDAIQLQAQQKLRQQVAASPYANEIDDETLTWFLLDRKLDTEEAMEKLARMAEWRRKLGADTLQLTDIAREAATGKAYIHHHLDKAGRPVVVVRASKHLTGAAPMIESEKLCMYVLDRGIEKLTPDQQTMLGIFDLRGFTARNADLVFARFMVDAFFTYYPKRVSQVLFVDAPWVFKPSWALIKPWLKKYAALVRFVTIDELRREYFTSMTLPEDFSAAPFLKDKI